MKKTALLLIVIAMLSGLISGCAGGDGDPAPTDTVYTAENIAAAVIRALPELPALYAVGFSHPEFASYAPLYLGELSDKVTDGVICYPSGPLASEVTVFAFASDEDAASAQGALEAYKNQRAGAFFGYAPEESALAEAGLVLLRGSFAALVICYDTNAARSAFGSCFGPDAPEPPELDSPAPSSDPEPVDPEPGPSEPEPGPSEPEPVTGGYDHDAVVEAWKTGGTSGLSPKDLAVYDACARVLGEIITPGMTDYEKELAVNDWMVFSAEYDPAELESGPLGVPDPDNDNPYGFLINGVGICLGYSSTFQLFMDLLGIECITVRGYAYGGSEEHAWNMVRLDGDWYCVDVTWNDPVFTGWVPTQPMREWYAHVYFNVTSDYMRSTDHQWTQDVPEAEGVKYAYPS